MPYTKEQLKIEKRRRGLLAEKARRSSLSQGQVEIEDIPLDPNKIMNALPPPEMPKFRKQPDPLLPMPVREQVPSISGFLTPETLGGRMLAKGPQIAGGTIGGMLGAAIPSIGEEPALVAGGSALGNWLLAPTLAAMGGAVGRATTLPTDDPNYGKKLLFAALEEGLGEYAGRGISAGLGKMFLRPFRGAVIPGAEIADQTLRQAGKRTRVIPGIRPAPRTAAGKARRGVSRAIFKLGQRIKGEPGAARRLGKQYGAHLLPGQTTESFMDTLQAVAEGSFFGGGAIRRFQTQTQKAALENLQTRLSTTVKRNLIKKVGTKKATAILSDLSNADATALKTIESSLYQTIDDLAEIKINIEPLQELAESLKGRGLKPGTRERMLRQVTRKTPQQTFEELKNIRSDAWQEWNKFNRAGEKNNARIARMIATKTDDLMSQAAEQGSPQLKAAWRTADEFHKGRLRVDWLADTLAKYGKAEDVAAGKGFVNYIAKVSKKIEGKPSELTKMGFSSSEINQIKNVANAAKFVAEKAVGGGRMLVQLTQAGALMQIAGVPLAAIGMAKDQPGLTSAGAFMIIGPTLLAKMMLSPTGSKLLSTGLRAPAGSRSIGTTGVRLLRELAYHEVERRMKNEPPQLWLRYISIKPRITPQAVRKRPEIISEQYQ